jgi:hypothetical protein
MSLNLETSFEPALPPDANLSSQVDRILKSEPFRGSETLRNLLSYLSSRAVESPARPVKVREIAKAVFGRSEDFDSQTDSIVRVHAGRVRSKLAEFYLNEGAEDVVVLSIPKGGYNLTWETRPGRAIVAGPEAVLPQLPRAAQMRNARRAVPMWALVSVAIAVAVLAWGTSGLLQLRAENSKVPSPIRIFWRDFVASPGSPVIVFSNLTLSDWRRPGQQIANAYTTTGEVMGVFGIARTLSLLNKPVRAKPGGLLTWDDAKDSDLVFVGGPLAETPLRDVALFKEFQFKSGEPGGAPKPGEIVNLHPLKGEAAIYVGDLSHPMRFDYGLIALRPALDPKRHILALAGIDFYGTQAAVEFVTRAEKMQELLSRLNVKNGSPLPSFEALIHVAIHGDVPVQSEILAVRREP